MTSNTDKIIKICDQLIAWSIYASLALVPVCFAFRQENFNIFELNKLVVFKTALSLALLATLLKICLTKQAKVFAGVKFFLPLLLLFVYLVINTLLAIDPAQSFFGNYMRQQGLHSLIYYFLWFIVLTLNLQETKILRRSLLAILIGLLPVLAYGFIQKLGFDPLQWSEPGSNRTFANLGQPNFLGYYLDLTVFLSLACFVFARRIWHKVALSVLVLLQLIVMTFTGSRGALMGLLAGLVVFCALRLWRSGKKSLVLVICGLFLALLISSHFFVNQLVSRKIITNPLIVHYSSAFSAVTGSSQVRLFYWQSAWTEFQTTSWTRRLFGYGKDSQRAIYVKYYRPDWGLHEKLNSYPDRAHNLLIDLWLEFGLLGMLLFAVFNGLIIAHALRFYLHNAPAQSKVQLIPYLLAALSAYFVSNLFGFPLTTHYVYYYFILALLMVISTEEREKIIDLAVSQLFCVLLAGALMIFNWFFLWQFTYKYFIADTYFMKAKVAEAKLDCQGMLSGVNQATYWQPLDFYYQEKFLFMYNNCLPMLSPASRKEAMGDLLTHLADTEERNYDYDLTLNTAHTYSLFGSYLDKKYYLEAAKYYQTLINLNPYILSAYQDYGRMKMWSGDYEGAKAILQLGIKQSPMQLANYQEGGYHGLTDSQTYYLWKLVADCDYHEKRFAEALAIYLDIEARSLVSVELYKNIADTYYQLKNYPQTEIYLLKNLALVPTDLNVNLGLASFYFERANFSEARRFTKATLALAADNQEAKQLLAKLDKLKK